MRRSSLRMTTLALALSVPVVPGMNSPGTIVHGIRPEDVDYLKERWLFTDENGITRCKCLPAEEFKSVPKTHLQLFCGLTARYVLPSQELIHWLMDSIEDRPALEVASGNGDIYYHLGIKGSDSYVQQEPVVKAYYGSIAQAPTNPPPDVLKLDALAAVQQENPEVLIACYLTRRFEPTDDGQAQASVYGPREEELLDHASVKTYIHVGNEATHGRKTLLTRNHQAINAPWIVTRASQPEHNVIYIWSKKHHA